MCFKAVGGSLITWLYLSDVYTEGNTGDHNTGMDMDVDVANDECYAETDKFVLRFAPLPDVHDNVFDDDEFFDSEHDHGEESVADQDENMLLADDDYLHEERAVTIKESECWVILSHF